MGARQIRFANSEQEGTLTPKSGIFPNSAATRDVLVTLAVAGEFEKTLCDPEILSANAAEKVLDTVRKYEKWPEVDFDSNSADPGDALTRCMMRIFIPLRAGAGLLDWYWHKSLKRVPRRPQALNRSEDLPRGIHVTAQASTGLAGDRQAFVRLLKNWKKQGDLYSQLLKLRINVMVVASAWCGAHLAAVKSGVVPGTAMWNALTGIGVVAAGTAAMNQIIERGPDAVMHRTQNRPLVTGAIGVAWASVLSALLIFGGTLYLRFTTNWLTGLLTFATCVMYLGIYTPLKKRTSWCTAIGAVPGAMPAVLGWTAIRGRLDWEAMCLFAILFCWQFPHFYSIALLYREDYARAGIRMLPVAEPDGRSTTIQVLVFTLALLAATAAPLLLHMAGLLYFSSALLLGSALLWFSVQVWQAQIHTGKAPSKLTARRLLQASVLYLPLLLTMLAIDAR